MKVFIIAGEPSGDMLGAAVMAGLRQQVPDISFIGVGGSGMEGQGLNSLFPMQDLSVMGIAEVLPKYFHLKRRIRQTADAVLAAAPDAMITIDSPDFSLRVAKLVKAAWPSQKTIHCVAPTVWAWRPGRAVKMARVIDHVLALFPFEPPYMEAAGMGCDFVGHPVVAEPIATAAEIAAFRADLGAEGPVILALPGSRQGEVTRLAPTFGQSLARVIAARPGARVIVPTVRAQAETVRDLVADWPGDPLVLDPDKGPRLKRAAFAAADVALAASGTVSLELAAAGTPMVIAYDMNWLSRQIISRMLIVDTVTLVNLVSETRVVPEFIGARCQPELIAPAILSVLDQPRSQQDAMIATMTALGRGGPAPGDRAADAVLRVIASD
ncbi:lipid-A-disaccharide synthase [Actibacterium sp. 188UL27-1]|uniref:lipid-A-disaccharide synthase n=1 Tax=Actibacterium sp. 188UL27-1 TaxID=2786961 RepID=UPI00195AC8A3|nr:lipid-A-disaccharide synthase [Actibacterium sp. 188UL27-1]MBM7067706.1 lipid-A-disaccharide synthase [Actibacterium sp. 188UL27-1]